MYVKSDQKALKEKNQKALKEENGENQKALKEKKYTKNYYIFHEFLQTLIHFHPAFRSPWTTNQCASE